MDRNLPNSLHVGYWAGLKPNHPAIIDAETGAITTFAEYERGSNRVAHLMRKLGLKPGDQTVLMVENRPEFLVWFWGMIRAGLRVTPVSTHARPEEIDYIIRDCGADLFLSSGQNAEMAARCDLSAIPPAARLMADIPMDGFTSFDAALEGLPETPIDDEVEGIEMLYSSGTTGRPKGIRKPMPAGPFGEGGAMLRYFAREWHFDADTIYLHPAPLYHAAPLRFANRINRLGGTVILMRKFDPEACLANIEKYGVTHSQWVPTHFNRLLKLPGEIRAKYDHSTMKCAIHAAAPCPHDVKRAMIEWWGPILIEYYGASEGIGHCAITSAEWLEKPGSVGQAKMGRLHICGDDGEELPVGQAGTIYFEGGGSFAYHNDPAKTEGAKHPKGWCTIGDVGYVDEDGYLFLTDRKAFMIISGGVNIYPQEIEEHLLKHPKVADAAVFGIPNADYGEEVKAVVQLKDGQTGSDALSSEIIEFCRATLNHVKCPRSVDFIDVMPRGENGKLYKKTLLDPYWKGRKRTPADAIGEKGGAA
ncbi:acyl-CoA synthetase [Lutimaribacter pacificus]|nr:acyl-CoA synthetase [Lutimaribacter pacificus]